MYCTDLMSQAAATYGAVDIVISNAGVVLEKQWKKSVDLNLVWLNILLH